MEHVRDRPIYWGRCACECGCKEGTGPFASRDAARSGVCGDCQDELCKQTEQEDGDESNDKN